MHRYPHASGLCRAYATLLLFLLFAGGCARMRPKLTPSFVFVTAKQAFLRDRIAAVSNRTGNVSNGDKLEVLEHGRHFIKVRTSKGEVGWIEEKAVATQDTFAAFDALARDHAASPAVASAVVRDEVYMHLKPGRDAERLYRLAEGDKLKLLARATLPKASANAPLRPATVPKPPTAAAVLPLKTGKPAPGPPGPAGPIMEDWWLVRDAQNHTGWIYSRMMDVDAPDAITRYAEGQRVVGAYVLTTIPDPDAPQDEKNVPLYVAVMSPYKAGLPYDFDQLRIFTWSLKKHRYETAFREKNIEGFLPVTISRMKDPYGKSALAQTETPAFTYKVLPADLPTPIPDPVTGAITPSRLIAKTCRLESTTVHRILPPGQSPEPEAHPEPAPEAGKKGKKRK